MIAGRTIRRLTSAAMATAFAVSLGVPVAHAAPGQVPIQLVPSTHIGWEVDRTTGANACTVASNNECRPGKQSSEAGGFNYPNSVAISPKTGDLYVADSANNRVQELTASGAFVVMFGWGVNETKDRQATASQVERNVCSAASGDVCGAGALGAAAGQLAYPGSVAVAPTTGDVYVLEISSGDYRVDKYTSEGRFVWMIGRRVNATIRGSLCNEREIERSRVKCGAGAENRSESIEPGAFKFAQTYGDLLAVGGPENLLYVGDEHRVQEFESDGKWKREILLASLSSAGNSDVAALALDKSGDLYLVYRVLASTSGVGGEQANVIHKFNPNGEQVAEIRVEPTQPNATVSINGLAVDSRDRLAVIGNENRLNSFTRLGSLYNGRTCVATSFGLPGHRVVGSSVSRCWGSPICVRWVLIVPTVSRR